MVTRFLLICAGGVTNRTFFWVLNSLEAQKKYTKLRKIAQKCCEKYIKSDFVLIWGPDVLWHSDFYAKGQSEGELGSHPPFLSCFGGGNSLQLDNVIRVKDIQLSGWRRKIRNVVLVTRPDVGLPPLRRTGGVAQVVSVARFQLQTVLRGYGFNSGQVNQLYF